MLLPCSLRKTRYTSSLLASPRYHCPRRSARGKKNQCESSTVHENIVVHANNGRDRKFVNGNKFRASKRDTLSCWATFCLKKALVDYPQSCCCEKHHLLVITRFRLRYMYANKQTFVDGSITIEIGSSPCPSCAQKAHEPSISQSSKTTTYISLNTAPSLQTSHTSYGLVVAAAAVAGSQAGYQQYVLDLIIA